MSEKFPSLSGPAFQGLALVATFFFMLLIGWLFVQLPVVVLRTIGAIALIIFLFLTGLAFVVGYHLEIKPMIEERKELRAIRDEVIKAMQEAEARKKGDSK